MHGKQQPSRAAAVVLLLALVLSLIGYTPCVGASTGLDRHLLTAAVRPKSKSIDQDAPAVPAALEAQSSTADVAATGIEAAAATSLTTQRRCPGGYALQGTTCWPCAPWYYSPGGTSRVCKPCLLGWTSGRAQQACTQCPVGSTTTKQGSASCNKCKAGYAGVNCAQCDFGTYSPGGTASAANPCKRCPPGKTTRRKGAISRTECNKDAVIPPREPPVIVPPSRELTEYNITLGDRVLLLPPNVTLLACDANSLTLPTDHSALVAGAVLVSIMNVTGPATNPSVSPKDAGSGAGDGEPPPTPPPIPVDLGPCSILTRRVTDKLVKPDGSVVLTTVPAAPEELLAKASANMSTFPYQTFARGVVAEDDKWYLVGQGNFPSPGGRHLLAKSQGFQVDVGPAKPGDWKVSKTIANGITVFYEPMFHLKAGASFTLDWDGILPPKVALARVDLTGELQVGVRVGMEAKAVAVDLPIDVDIMALVTQNRKGVVPSWSSLIYVPTPGGTIPVGWWYATIDLKLEGKATLDAGLKLEASYAEVARPSAWFGWDAKQTPNLNGDLKLPDLQPQKTFKLEGACKATLQPKLIAGVRHVVGVLPQPKDNHENSLSALVAARLPYAYLTAAATAEIPGSDPKCPACGTRCSNLPWSLKVDVGAGGKIWPLGVVKKAAEFLLGTKDPSYTFEPEALKIPLLDQKFCDKLPEALAPVIRNSICCVGRADPFPGIALVATPDTATCLGGQTTTINVLANDGIRQEGSSALLPFPESSLIHLDVDRDTVSPGVTIVQTDNKLLWTPPPNLQACTLLTDRFSYKVDDECQTATGSVTVAYDSNAADGPDYRVILPESGHETCANACKRIIGTCPFRPINGGSTTSDLCLSLLSVTYTGGDPQQQWVAGAVGHEAPAVTCSVRGSQGVPTSASATVGNAVCVCTRCVGDTCDARYWKAPPTGSLDCSIPSLALVSDYPAIPGHWCRANKEAAASGVAKGDTGYVSVAGDCVVARGTVPPGDYDIWCTDMSPVSDCTIAEVAPRNMRYTDPAACAPGKPLAHGRLCDVVCMDGYFPPTGTALTPAGCNSGTFIPPTGSCGPPTACILEEVASRNMQYNPRSSRGAACVAGRTLAIGDSCSVCCKHGYVVARNTVLGPAQCKNGVYTPAKGQCVLHR